MEMEIAIIVLVSIVIILQLISIFKNKSNKSLNNNDLEEIKKVVSDTNTLVYDKVENRLVNQTILLENSNKHLFEKLDIKFQNLENNYQSLLKTFENTKNILQTLHFRI